MSLAFLAPAALLLSGLALGPILAHLMRRRPSERAAFGAILLIDRIQNNIERRRRIHDRLLLFLRILALACGLLALAQPEFRLPAKEARLGGSGRVVVVLDTSLSMDQRQGGESAFVRAQREAAATLRSLGEGVQVAVFAAGVPEQDLTPTWTADRALAATEVESATPAYGTTDLDGALIRARMLLGGVPGEVLVYTDGSGPGNVARSTHSVERLLATGSALLPRPVGVVQASNLVVTEVEYGDGLEGGTVNMTVQNFGADAREVPVTVELPDGVRMTVFVNVPRGDDTAPGEANASVTVPRQAAGGVASVSLTDSGLPMDDSRYFHLPRVGVSRVLVVDGDPGSSPTKSEVYFLERALAPHSGVGAALDVVSPAGALRLSEGQSRVAVVANIGDPTQLAPTLVEFVRGGGALILSVGDNVSAPVWNSALSSLLPAHLSRTRDLVSLDADEGAPLDAPELGIDIFEPFATAGRAGFERVRSRRIVAVEGYAESDEVRTLLRYRGGAPALIERKIGSGRVYLWTSTIDLGWSNFPLQSIYAPFWSRFIAWLGGEVGDAAARMQAEVGEVVSVPVPAGDSLAVTGPRGERVGVARLPGAITFTPEAPGAYAVGRTGEPPVAWVAVNVPTRESDVRPDESFEAAKVRLDPERVHRRVPLDAGLVVAGALLLAVAAGLGARSVKDVEEATT